MNIEEAIIGVVMSPKEHKGITFYLTGIADRLHVKFMKVGSVISGLRGLERGCTFRYALPSDVEKDIPYIGELPKVVLNHLKTYGEPGNGGRGRTFIPSPNYINPRPYLGINPLTKERREYNSLLEAEADGFNASSISHASGDTERLSGNGWVWLRKGIKETPEALEERIARKLKIFREWSIKPIFYVNVKTGDMGRIDSTGEFKGLGFSGGNVYKNIREETNHHAGHIFVQCVTEEESVALLQARLEAFKEKHKNKKIRTK